MQYNLLKIASMVKTSKLPGVKIMPVKALSYRQSLPSSRLVGSSIVPKSTGNSLSFKQTWDNLDKKLTDLYHKYGQDAFWKQNKRSVIAASMSKDMRQRAYRQLKPLEPPARHYEPTPETWRQRLGRHPGWASLSLLLPTADVVYGGDLHGDMQQPGTYNNSLIMSASHALGNKIGQKLYGNGGAIQGSTPKAALSTTKIGR